LGQVDGFNSIVTVKCRTIIKEKTIDLFQVTNNSIVTVQVTNNSIVTVQVTITSIVTVKIVVLHFTVTMELLVTWDRSMVFSFIAVLHLTVTI
jgi:hypothetical protein